MVNLIKHTVEENTLVGGLFNLKKLFQHQLGAYLLTKVEITHLSIRRNELLQNKNRFFISKMLP